MSSMDFATALITYGVMLLVLLGALLGLVQRTRKGLLLAAVGISAAWLMWMQHRTGQVFYGETMGAISSGYLGMLLRPRDPLQSHRFMLLAVLFLAMALASRFPAPWHWLGQGAAVLGLGTALVPRAWIGRIENQIGQRIGARK